MRKSFHSPSLVKDISALAGLYRNVFWMMGHKVNYNEELLPAKLRARVSDLHREERDEVTAGSR